MDAEILEFPGGFGVYGSGKRIFGNRSTSKHWKHMVTIITGHSVSPGLCPMLPTHQARSWPPSVLWLRVPPAPHTPRPQGWLIKHWSLFLFTCSQVPPDPGLLPTGSADAACPRRINEAHLGLAPSYRTWHEAVIFKSFLPLDKSPSLWIPSLGNPWLRVDLIMMQTAPIQGIRQFKGLS